ncbi:helix-turn-helix transcriptional regulator [Arsenicicoccus sp. oral taxon 190]|uniref:helix-turn-helix transcriptional regulator n=1 Tax=Arsenicicoccus sp. oral taxon 190 TaxID=1658671 RepID=UPI00067A0BC5|nr:helix-turn-helix domain-containing protein [Arsenicicoccus sp. oral taxon 190]AKT51119.1 hypothetical protein ADJ73_06955 [Arsenicicoccus sp. oral taxon 190]
MPKERADLLSSGVRRQITNLITAAPDRWTALQLADELQLHVTTVRFHLDQLEQAGVIDSQPERRDRPGRPRKVYRRSSDEVPVNTAAYVILADVLAATLATQDDSDARAEAADRAGAAWVAAHLSGTPREAVDTPPDATGVVDARRAPATTAQTRQGAIPVKPLLDTLAQWGYPRETVTVEGDPATRCQATLTFCPMIDAARRHPDVVCGIHLGLVRGALEQLGVADPAVRVTPMVTPGVCTVDMSTADAGADAVTDGLDLVHVRRGDATPPAPA